MQLSDKQTPAPTALEQVAGIRWERELVFSENNNTFQFQHWMCCLSTILVLRTALHTSMFIRQVHREGSSPPKTSKLHSVKIQQQFFLVKYLHLED